MSTTCNRCGAPIPEGVRFCNSCGAPQIPAANPAPKFCVSCGHPMATGSAFCNNCGTPVTPAASQPPAAAAQIPPVIPPIIPPVVMPRPYLQSSRRWSLLMLRRAGRQCQQPRHPQHPRRSSSRNFRKHRHPSPLFRARRLLRTLLCPRGPSRRIKAKAASQP